MSKTVNTGEMCEELGVLDKPGSRASMNRDSHGQQGQCGTFEYLKD